MATLIIRHDPDAAAHAFTVQRVGPMGVKTAPAVQIADPLRRALGDTQMKLGDELVWYLEQYLDYPFGPNEQRAERVIAALRSWGEETFAAQFQTGQARDFYHDATVVNHSELNIVIASDAAAILAWPWEALYDPLAGNLGQLCRIERQLDKLNDPPPLPENLSRQRIGILLVTARPYENDVAYRSISRPLVELIQERGLPAEVTVLRPPTLKQMRDELRANPGAYHIVHFDGHGTFSAVSDSGPPAHLFRSPQGQLVFENEDGSADPVTAKTLSHVLREHCIPIAVLNACQSGMQSAGAEDVFASVATALLRAGIRSVVAMGYALYVSAAREFLPAFYERLFDSGNIAEATRAGRQALFQQPKRVSARGLYPLRDWLVPVLYQQQPISLAFDPRTQTSPTQQTELTEVARLNPVDNPYGMVGRDSAILALERAMRRLPSGILVHGLGGVGKTTLARGFTEWLAQTNGMPDEVIWLSFVDIRSADYVFNRLVKALFGISAMAAPDVQKLPALVQALRKKAYLVVWDNFESFSGAADGAEPSIPQDERQKLKNLLEQLRGGKSKILITSRSDEVWLEPTSCFRIPLNGLQKEERWALTEAMLADLAINANRDDEALVQLVNDLEGHPLMMRAILPKLTAQSAASLCQAIKRYVPEASSVDPVEQKLYATLRFVEAGLPEKLKPLLYPVSLHEEHIDADFLAEIAKEAGQNFDMSSISECLQQLQAAGLTQGIRNNCYRLHPALTRYLRARAFEDETDFGAVPKWQLAFVRVMAKHANDVTPREMQEQRPFFAILGGCIAQARLLAEQIEAKNEYELLVQSQGSFALNCRDMPLAERHYLALARHFQANGPKARLAVSYHQLGMMAEARRNLTAAEIWHRESLEIFERLGDMEKVAGSFHQLGMVAEERRDFAAAKCWYRKSLAINKHPGNERAASINYHQLGMVAEKQLFFATARKLHRQSLAIKERLHDEHGKAKTYHQLGSVAVGQGDLAAAVVWYDKSLTIKKSLGDKHGAAISYHQLGHVAEQRRNLLTAEELYRKSLVIMEELGDKHFAAISYGALGNLAEQRGEPVSAVEWLLEAYKVFASNIDQHFVDMASQDIKRIRNSASPEQQAKIDALCATAGLGSFLNP